MITVAGVFFLLFLFFGVVCILGVFIHLVGVEAGCNWYLLDMKKFTFSKKRVRLVGDPPCSLISFLFFLIEKSQPFFDPFLGVPCSFLPWDVTAMGSL